MLRVNTAEVELRLGCEAISFEPVGEPVGDDIPPALPSMSFDVRFDVASTRWQRFCRRLSPPPPIALIDRRARRHAVRPPTRGYWVRRCRCLACRLLRDGVAVIPAGCMVQLVESPTVEVRA